MTRKKSSGIFPKIGLKGKSKDKPVVVDLDKFITKEDWDRMQKESAEQKERNELAQRINRLSPHYKRKLLERLNAKKQSH